MYIQNSIVKSKIYLYSFKNFISSLVSSAVWHDKPIPDVLISGHHAKIEQWKREQSLINTLKKRPDMLEKAELTEKEKKLAEEVQKEVKKSL